MFSLFSRKARQAKVARRTPPSFRPRLEVLEERCCPSGGGGHGGGGSGSSSSYSVTDLGTLGGATSLATGIDNATSTHPVQVVGQADTGATYTLNGVTNPVSHAFLYQNGAMTDLGTLGGLNSRANAINSSTQAVVGWADTGATYTLTAGNTTLVQDAFLYQNGKMTDLGTLGGPEGSDARAINSSGWVVGSADTGVPSPNGGNIWHAFVGQMVNGTFVMTDLNSLLPAGSKWQLTNPPGGINDNGYIAGSGLVNGYTEAYLFHVIWNGTGFQGDTITNLGNLENLSTPTWYVWANGVNSANQVVGASPTTKTKDAPFLWQNGTMTDLAKTSGTYGAASSINNLSSVQIVGDFYPNNGQADHAFLWQSGTLSDLNSLAPSNSGWVLESANGINDSGAIAGYGTINNQTHAFLALPPTTTAATTALTTSPVRSIVPAAITSSTFSSETSQAAPPAASSSLVDSTLVTDSVPANLTAAPAAPSAAAAAGAGASSNGSGWSAFQVSVLGTLEQDLSQWEDAMTKDLASLTQTIDQLFADWDRTVLGSPVANPTL